MIQTDGVSCVIFRTTCAGRAGKFVAKKGKSTESTPYIADFIDRCYDKENGELYAS